MYVQRRDFNRCIESGEEYVVGRGVGDKISFADRPLTDEDLQRKEAEYNPRLYEKEMEKASVAALGEAKTKKTAREVKNEEKQAKADIKAFLKP